jgi:hypothetical protein
MRVISKQRLELARELRNVALCFIRQNGQEISGMRPKTLWASSQGLSITYSPAFRSYDGDHYLVIDDEEEGDRSKRRKLSAYWFDDERLTVNVLRIGEWQRRL